MGVFDHLLSTTPSTTTTSSKTTTPSGDKAIPVWVWFIIAFVVASGAAVAFASLSK